MVLMMRYSRTGAMADQDDSAESQIQISHFALSLHEDRDQPDAPRQISVQISRSGDESSVDFISLASTGKVIPELVIIAASELEGELLGDPTRMIFRNAKVETFVTQASRDSLNLEVHLVVRAETLTYEHGMRLFNQHRVDGEARTSH